MCTAVLAHASKAITAPAGLQQNQFKMNNLNLQKIKINNLTRNIYEYTNNDKRWNSKVLHP